MKTIKSYTDIEQSRELAKILPIESADMYWLNGSLEHSFHEFTPRIISIGYIEINLDVDAPCWSLAALLEVLHCNKKDIMCLSHGCYIDGIYKKLYATDYEFEDGNYMHTYADNPIDACYEMIIMLNEQNLL